MVTVSETDAAAIREVYKDKGLVAATYELRRRIPSVTNWMFAVDCARSIVAWNPLGRRVKLG